MPSDASLGIPLEVAHLHDAAFTWGPFVLTAGFVAALAVFALRSAFLGQRAPHARVEKLGGSVVLAKSVMEAWMWATGPVVRGAIALGVHPDVFSWTSLVLQVGAALLLARGEFPLGGWLLVTGSFCDAIDGAVARARGLASDAGEVLDAAVDRWAEMAVFFGYAWYYRDLWWGFALACGACAGAVMVSYARAKGEAYGIDAAMGLMQRHERAAWLSVSTVFSGLYEALRPTPVGEFVFHTPVLVALAFICVLGNRTGWIRTAHVRAELRRR